VLTPAACYHVYLLLEGRDLAEPARLTTRATCFRREARHEALRRQWAFEMREFVCVGTRDECEAHLDRFRARARRFCEQADLDLRLEPATDPFFDPRHSPGYALQRVAEIKTELVCDGLALGSLNRHGEFFGRAFGIRRDGATASSACVAFGLERLLHALTARHGERWPEVLPASGPA
jgi:hypothetical protein